MSQSVTWNGVSYSVPDPNDTGWGPSLTSYLVALPAGALQKNGGTFTLTNDVDFGATFGLKATYFKSRTANIATTGVFRLANAEGIIWRNAANSADLALSVDASNRLTYNGNVLFPSTGILPIAAGGTNSSAALNNNRVMQSSGGAIVEAAAITANRALISDANGIPTQSTTTNTELAGLHSLTASRAVATDGSGILTASAVTATELGYMSGVTSAVQTQLNARGLRNHIVNADMAIDQRKEGTALTVNATTSFFGLDQWTGTGGAAAGVFTFQRALTTPPTGFNYYLHAVVTTNDAAPSAGQSYSVRQDIEVFNMPDIYYPTSVAAVTLSFWVRSSVTGTYGVGLVNVNASAIRSYVGQYTINSANTWEFKTISIPTDTGLTNTMTYGTYALQVRFDLGSGSSRESTASAWSTAAAWRANSNTKLISTNAATWDVTGVQLEAGTIATSFEYMPFDLQLLRCQRYYEKSYKIGIAPGGSDTSNQYIVNASQFNATSMEAGNIAFKVRKRTVPTVTLYKSDGSNNNFDWTSTGGVTTNRTTTVPEITETAFAVRQTVAVEYMGIGHWVADAS